MKSRRFRPTAVDVLEERLVLTAFSVPFTLVNLTPGHVNPKFVNLTGRAESQVNHAITGAFNQFSHGLLGAINVVHNGAAKPGANTPALLATFDSSVTQSLNRLSGALTSLSLKVPFGGVNLNPVLQMRIIGSGGVTDTTTKVNKPSLQTQLATLTPSSSTSTVQDIINSTESLIRSDVKDYINLGVTNGDFKLTRGASLPPLS
jgi:hypothetical protein